MDTDNQALQVHRSERSTVVTGSAELLMYYLCTDT